MKRAWLGFAAAAACSAISIASWCRWYPALVELLGARAWWILAAELAALALSAFSAWKARAPDASLSFAGWVRAWLVGCGLAWLAFLVCVDAYEHLWLELALGPAAGIVAGALYFERASLRWPRTRARLARAMLLGLSLAPLLLEGTLRAWSEFRPSPLLLRETGSPGRMLELNRERPGSLRFGFPCNSRGHYDDEFARSRPDETRVAVIGDSFSQGTVPHALHYTSVAERALGFPVDNFGVAAIGPPEYEELLLKEVLPLDPSAVVIALFIGNDLDLPAEENERDPTLRSWLDRDKVLVCLLPGRLARLRAEQRANPEGAVRVQGEQGRADPALALEQRYPWIADPLLEAGTISEKTFLGIEMARVNQVCPLREDELERVVHVLERMRDACGTRPLCVMLIPDEFQVEDELWSRVQAPGLERDRPQRLLVTRLAQSRIPVLDLEPALRAVAPLADGKRHVYQLHDTHFNARGNRAAGEALAPFVREVLKRAK